MGTLSAIAFVASSLTKSNKIALAIVAAVAVVLVIAIVVISLRRRKRRAAGASDTAPADVPANGSGPLAVAPPATPDQATPDQATTTWAPPPPPPPPPPPALADNPPTGTPAGWLPEPDGTPDTLRYWDGVAWTQHVAQRT